MSATETLSGKIACLAVIVLTVAFGLSMLAIAPHPYISANDYLSSFSFRELIPVFPSFLLVFANVLLFAAVFFYSETDRKVYALAGILTGACYAVCCGIAYYLQLALVPAISETGDAMAAGIFVISAPGSFAGVLVSLGYLLLGISFLFFSMIFNARGLSSWIKSIFIIYGISAVLGTVGYLIRFKILELMVVLAIMPYLAGVVLLYLEFSRQKNYTEGTS